MPGPGGGSRGGGGGFSGGSRGGGFGGGPRPGGFGGHHHHHHGPHFGWGFGRRHYYGGGGCLGALMTPFIIAIFLIFSFVYMFLPAGNVQISTSDDFGKNYNEAAFQRAADAKYSEYFDHGATYEDNILLYFLVEEDCEDIYFIAWVGDNVTYDVAEHFGNNYTTLGQLVNSHVANYYAYSLDSNLASLIGEMEKVIVSEGLESSFKTEPAAKALPSESRLVDLTGSGEPRLTASTVNAALESFTEATGIRTVVCVDYIDNVFEASGGMSWSTIFFIFALIVLGVAIFIAVKSSKKGKN